MTILTPSKDQPYSRLKRTLLLALLTPALLVGSPTFSGAQDNDRLEFSSVEERRLFEDINRERQKLREDKKDVELRKKELKSIEEAVDKKLAELDAKLEKLARTQRKLETLLVGKKEEERKRTQNLAKIYEKMAPQKAALALSGLEPELASDLLAVMKVKAAAKILDQMSKQKATELSTTFSTIQLE